MACSGIISSTPSKPQNDGGKLGHTIKTLRFEPSGGKKGGLPHRRAWVQKWELEEAMPLEAGWGGR